MDTLLFSISGLRGIVGRGLHPEAIIRYTTAFARSVGPGPVVVGRDSRPSGAMVEALVEGALMAAGRDVIPLGIMPTPVIQWTVATLRTPGGIAVTASHNPAEWNALKFMGRAGIFLNAAQTRAVARRTTDSALLRHAHRRPGVRRDPYPVIPRFLDASLALPCLAPARIRRRRWAVALDCVNGAGCVLLPALLERLGCQVTAIHSKPTGIFPRGPEPIPAHLGDLSRAVRRSGSVVGFAVDPDADRLAIVDETGCPIGEDYTLMLAAWQLAASEMVPMAAIVTTLSTTRLVDAVGAEYNFRVVRTKVGEAHVVERMRRAGIRLGGEGNGGVILGDFHYGRDAAVGMALILQLLTDARVPISAVTSWWPRYVMCKAKEAMTAARYRRGVARLRKHWRGARTSTLDGIRVDTPEYWFHVRPSNTEPVVRIISEAADAAAAEAVIAQVRAVMA